MNTMMLKLLRGNRKRWWQVAMIAYAIAACGQEVPGTRFVLRWLEGECSGCRIATGLDRLQFTGSDEAWGVGCTSGPVGTGDYIVIRTKNTGRTWTEVAQTYQHAGAPAFSFVDASRGWIAWWNPADSPRVIKTVDRGEHWQDLPGRFVQRLQFVDGSHGYGSDGSKFLRTEDGGVKWNEINTPTVRVIDRLYFLSREVGWIAGTDGKRFLVFRTANGGRTWEESRTEAPEHIDNVADLFFVDPQRGWLITWHGGDGGTNLFETTNGGKTWTPEADASFQGPRKWARVVRFVSERLGFVFESEESSANQARSTLVYTYDGGAHWEKKTIPHTVYDCQVFQGDLRCSAGSNRPGFLLLTVHPK